jgi:hypothetical protein
MRLMEALTLRLFDLITVAETIAQSLQNWHNNRELVEV